MSSPESPATSGESNGSLDDLATLLDEELFKVDGDEADGEEGEGEADVEEGQGEGGGEQEVEAGEEEQEEVEEEEEEQEEEEVEEEEQEGEEEGEGGEDEENKEGEADVTFGSFSGIASGRDGGDRRRGGGGREDDASIVSLKVKRKRENEEILANNSYEEDSPTKKVVRTTDSAFKLGAREMNVEQKTVTSTTTICPPHPGFIWGVCIRCGSLKEHDDDVKATSEPANVALRYIHEGLELSGREAARLRNNELESILAQEKLYLVLDLDHTLLNSARFVEVPLEDVKSMTRLHWGEGVYKDDGMHSSPPLGTTLFELPQLGMWTKLRPGVHRFLKEASNFFEMIVYTNGEKRYAKEMANLLDPTGRLFKERVISHGDSTLRGTKDLDVVLGADTAVLILDDTTHVWPRHRDNLLQVEQYHFFGYSRRQFGLRGPSLCEQKRDESATEGSLASLLPALQRVHSKFFSAMKTRRSGKQNNAPDVRKILRGVRAEILSTCHIVFSRVFPRNIPRPDSHPLWKMAKDMGAICHLSSNSKITHVVAIDKTTDKSVWATKNDRHLVHPRWVEASYFLWKRASEENFPVGKEVSKKVEEGVEKGEEEEEEEGGNGEDSTSSMNESTEADVMDTAHGQESVEGKKEKEKREEEKREEGKKEEEKKEEEKRVEDKAEEDKKKEEKREEEK